MFKVLILYENLYWNLISSTIGVDVQSLFQNFNYEYVKSINLYENLYWNCEPD